MSVSETFGVQVEVEIKTAEKLIADHQDLFLDASNESVTKRRYEMEFLNSVGFLRDFIEENRKAGQRGRLVILFKGNDRIPRIKALCETAKLSETNNKDPRWDGPVNLLSRVCALEELLENATDVADTWVDELVRFEKARSTSSTTGSQPVAVPKESAQDETEDGDDDEVYGNAARVCADDVDSEDEQEYFAKKKQELLSSSSAAPGVETKKFMKPPPLVERAEPKFRKQDTINLPTLKETKLLDLADIEQGVYTSESFQGVERVEASYVRTCLQSTTRFSDQKVQSFVPVGQKPEQPVKLRSVPKKDGETFGTSGVEQQVEAGEAGKLPSPGSAGDGAGGPAQLAAAPGREEEGAGSGASGTTSTGVSQGGPAASASTAGASSSLETAVASSSSVVKPSKVPDLPLFQPNDLIVICGLKSEKAASFNGREGIILGYVAETKKYDALIDGKTRIMVKGENIKGRVASAASSDETTSLKLIFDAWMFPFTTLTDPTKLTWNTNLRGTFADVNGAILSRASSYQNSAQGAGKNFARAIKGLLSLDNPDGVVAVSAQPIPRHGQGYFVEVEVVEVTPKPEESVGCLGLGVSFLNPDVPGQIEKIPRRLEKIEQGWFFSGPYYGQTRRLYKDGQKDIRYILDGEDSAPIKWKPGDRMSVLVRPKDSTKADWIWTISMYANRDIVMACHMDLHPWLAQGSPVPKELEMFAFCEAFGYVSKVRLCNDATPTGLEIPFKPKALKEISGGFGASIVGPADVPAPPVPPPPPPPPA
ncbi:unnamed protein product [Amoebophrya sp. A120]|nr:unnamed protein product [Amoebophrya sp. A120]|eukprot:GSA120T00017428001.1